MYKFAYSLKSELNDLGWPYCNTNNYVDFSAILWIEVNRNTNKHIFSFKKCTCRFFIQCFWLNFLIHNFDHYGHNIKLVGHTKLQKRFLKLMFYLTLLICGRILLYLEVAEYKSMIHIQKCGYSHIFLKD